MWWKLWFSSRLTARAQAASNLKSPKALDLTLFAAAVRSLSSLTCYPLTTARDSPLQDFPCLTAYCINPSNSFRERKICISRTGLLGGLICDVRICERIKTGLMGHRSAWHHVSCRVAKYLWHSRRDDGSNWVIAAAINWYSHTEAQYAYSRSISSLKWCELCSWHEEPHPQTLSGQTSLQTTAHCQLPDCANVLKNVLFSRRAFSN